VSISSEHPVSSEQVYAALAALRAAPVLDPERRPEGPTAQDKLPLLGGLLAVVDLEFTAATRVGAGQDDDVSETVLGWARPLRRARAARSDRGSLPTPARRERERVCL
jgi:hypothetical protein